MKNLNDIIEKTDWKKVVRLAACAAGLYAVGCISNKVAEDVSQNPELGYYLLGGIDYISKAGALLSLANALYITLNKKSRRLG